MATLQLTKHKTASASASSFVPKEKYDAEMGQIQKRIDRIEKIQKAKNWKHNLTK